jgi:hypothetical protein
MKNLKQDHPQMQVGRITFKQDNPTDIWIEEQMLKAIKCDRTYMKNTKYLERKADRLWGEIMHSLYTKCAICESPKQLEAHHIIHRHRKATRHSIDNGIMLCHQHHVFAHCNPTEFMWSLEFNHRPRWIWVQANKNKIMKPDYRKAIKELEELKKRM